MPGRIGVAAIRPGADRSCSHPPRGGSELELSAAGRIGAIRPGADRSWSQSGAGAIRPVVSAPGRIGAGGATRAKPSTRLVLVPVLVLVLSSVLVLSWSSVPVLVLVSPRPAFPSPATCPI